MSKSFKRDYKEEMNNVHVSLDFHNALMETLKEEEKRQQTKEACIEVVAESDSERNQKHREKKFMWKGPLATSVAAILVLVVGIGAINRIQNSNVMEERKQFSQINEDDMSYEMEAADEKCDAVCNGNEQQSLLDEQQNMGEKVQILADEEVTSRMEADTNLQVVFYTSAEDMVGDELDRQEILALIDQLKTGRYSATAPASEMGAYYVIHFSDGTSVTRYAMGDGE